MTEKVDSPDLAAARELVEQLNAVMHSFSTDDLAAAAFVQSQLLRVQNRVLWKVIVQKNMMSDAELERRIAEAMRDAKKEFTNESVIVAPPLPSVRGN